MFKNSNYKFNKYLISYKKLLDETLKNLDNKSLDKAVNEIEITIKKKSNIFVCGNGGSHAIANHYVCDYFKVLEKDTKLLPKIISLCSDNALISAISNDFSYDDVFYYQAKRLFKKNDLLIVLSSSGNSKNIKKVLDYANKIKIKSIGFCSFTGGYVKKNCTIPIYSKVNNYGISEDINHILMHSMMQSIKLRNLKKNIKKPTL